MATFTDLDWAQQFGMHIYGASQDPDFLHLRVIVSNDNFAPFQKANPWLLDTGRVLAATHSQGVWVFNPRRPNPVGAAGRRR
ncbi:hypothetical protein AB0O67_24970 [Streptomyces sp. NPDC086077]|uniref:hypothetical protein n=1 Tax=Streptomyces sp. NPDC086077 TaxID=3154862 RepID=UPI00341434EA